MLVSHNTITQWYDSPVLDNELHTTMLSIVTVGQTTPLGSTSTIIVDVSNTEIKYQGSGWNPSGTSLMMNRGWANGATVRKFNLIARTPWIMLSDSDFLMRLETFVFDHLAYIPSFESLANKPDFTDTGSALPTPKAVAAPTQVNGQ
ncbi:hypothetical protein F5876DRAFT_62562 [Lentinula aff. lateritia]|uniref:Uncharacterized protein n=1 Tax=Lentinula aff. lateritia TaxID=2804960 RepID=A0ACC1UB31_9AGAR|nr:hypothetical protein F5876DRAFT_62562 [Lentinula aff. lateritia]